MVDVNVTTRNKVTKEQVFNYREPKKVKNVVHWEKEEKLKKSLVEIIEQI